MTLLTFAHGPVTVYSFAHFQGECRTARDQLQYPTMSVPFQQDAIQRKASGSRDTSSALVFSDFHPSASKQKLPDIISIQVPGASSDAISTEFHPRASQELDGFVTRRSSRIPADRRHHSTTSTHPVSPMPVVHSLNTDVLDAVVKTFTTHCEPNYGLPWQMSQQYDSSSTAFMLPNRRLLTNAHAVSFHTVVRVKKRTSDAKYIASVLAIGEECDLALLTVADDEFWADVSPLSFGSLPSLQDAVVVVGYPLGGENISVTAGVTSRIDLRAFSSANDFLTIQIDAAINPGNSGGPALNSNNQVVGVSFGKLTSSDNIGYLIAVSVVDHFLQDYDRNGRYTGSCICGFRWQTLADATFRKYLKMDDNETGVLVLGVDNTSEASDVLQKDDIVTAVDGVDISNAGTVPHTSGERILFHSILLSKFVDDSLSLSIIRDGKQLEVSYVVPNCLKNDIVPAHLDQHEPDYFMIAGMVFVVLTEPYLRHQYGSVWTRQAPIHFIQLWQHGTENDVEQVVVLSQVLNAEINVEYSHIVDERLHKVNGEHVRSLTHLAEIIGESGDQYLRFDLEWEVVVLDREKALASNQAILTKHHIPTIQKLPHLVTQGVTSRDEDSGSDNTD